MLCKRAKASWISIPLKFLKHPPLLKGAGVLFFVVFKGKNLTAVVTYIAISRRNKQWGHAERWPIGFSRPRRLLFSSLCKPHTIRVILNLFQNLPFGPCSFVPGLETPSIWMARRGGPFCMFERSEFTKRPTGPQMGFTPGSVFAYFLRPKSKKIFYCCFLFSFLRPKKEIKKSRGMCPALLFRTVSGGKSKGFWGDKTSQIVYTN